MFQTIKKLTKILIIFLVISIIVAVSIYIYIDKNDAVAKKLKDKDYISFSILLYGSEKLFPDRLDAYTILYDKKFNVLKVLSVNTDTVVFKKREKARSLKTLFNENSEKGINIAVKQFYADLYEIIGSAAAVDFYVNASFETLDAVMGYNEKFKLILSENNFENKDLKSLNRLETIKHILCLIPYRIMRICKNYNSLDTNISRLSFAVSILRFKFLKPVFMFCEMPVSYTKARVEPDKQNIEAFLNKIYYAAPVSQINPKNVLIDIKNAARKPRMAEKATWLLRGNKFDVLDWSNFSITYDKTLIKDYKGNFTKALKIAEILKAGAVIVSYNKRIYFDISVFVGKDCIIYDTLDKKGERNVKS
ncbi:MAG: LytR C-terminal domain-containing protein [Endomicrobium sp.]|jgi:hypothetical protein|nr:LytR C-terminal domain-containing protein [Endomicrobium sp.]